MYGVKIQEKERRIKHRIRKMENMIKVAINGYGTIGKRVADGVSKQDDMDIVGVAKNTPNFEARQAVEKGYDLYAASEKLYSGDVPVVDDLEKMLEKADVVVDATPSGIGEENKEIYKDFDIKSIFQGGEDKNVAKKSFNAISNYSDCIDTDSLRVVSCNTTGLLRFLTPLAEKLSLGRIRATLVRRGGDPTQYGRGPINDILPDPISLPSHHGPDVKSVRPDIDIFTTAVKVPSTLMHLHSINAEINVDKKEVIDILEKQNRIRLVRKDEYISSTAEIKEWALDIGRNRGDVLENAVWKNSIEVKNGELFAFQAIHQESNVIPENIDAIRSITGFKDKEKSMEKTNNSLNI